MAEDSSNPEIRRFPNPQFLPRIHFVTRDGKRVYRVWSNNSNSYITEEKSEQELKEWLIFEGFVKTVEDQLFPRKIEYGELPNGKWWEELCDTDGVLEWHRFSNWEDAYSERNVARIDDIAGVAMKLVFAYLACEQGTDMTMRLNRTPDGKVNISFDP